MTDNIWKENVFLDKFVFFMDKVKWKIGHFQLCICYYCSLCLFCVLLCLIGRKKCSAPSEKSRLSSDFNKCSGKVFSSIIMFQKYWKITLPLTRVGSNPPRYFDPPPIWQTWLKYQKSKNRNGFMRLPSPQSYMG